MHTRRLLLVTINFLIVLGLLITSLLGPFPIQVAAAHSLPSQSSSVSQLQQSLGLSARIFGQAALHSATTPSCEVYPIAVHTSTIAGVPVGGTLGDIYNGTQPGNFGWLSWTGSPSEPTLVASLTPPGNSDTYINPNDASDHTLAIDKWVFGKPGVSNSKAVRTALTNLESLDITVPVWDQATGNGSNSQYYVVGFAQVRITAFQLPGANRITATYLGNTPCGGGEPPPPSGPSLAGDTLTLSPSVAGPNITGTAQTILAQIKTRAGAPVSDITIHFTITGANAQTTLATTDSNGTATITYEGDVSGTDQIQASATSGGTTVTSHTSSVSWVTPTQAVSTSTVWGRFFPATNNVFFSATPSQTPAFSQAFPSLNFDPPANTVPGTPALLYNEETRPLVEIVTDANGQFAGAIVAQGNGFEAGQNQLFEFDAVFTGTLIVAAAGDLTFSLWHDDGFILGVGNGATRVSGPMTGAPSSGFTAFEGFPVLTANNIAVVAAPDTYTIHFPAPGAYPYELDWNECCADGLKLAMLTGSTTGAPPLPPTGILTLSPNDVPPQTVGTQQTFTVTATDAAGHVLPNLPVQLSVTGANSQQLQATTDASGTATFDYTGAISDLDTVQAMAWVSNLTVYSNQVLFEWVPSTSAPPTPPIATPGWIGSPASQSTQTGSVPIKLSSGHPLGNGTVDYWPIANPSAVTTLATNVDSPAGGTVATLDTTTLANGSYIVRVQGNDRSSLSGSGHHLISEVLITVVGQNKPGRVTFSVTDLTVPLTGMPITIGRTYDSLLRNQSGDFGNGWNLTVSTPKLTVDPAHNVTLTMPDGRRVTFFFTPQSVGGIFGFLFTSGYTAEAGVYGSLTADGCDLLAVSGGQYVCFPGTLYQPTSYTYTDPAGRAYVLDASTGALQSISDLDNNTLTFTPDGITSSAGNLNVPFVRDSAGCITKITDPAGNVYSYSYDSDRNLVSVTLPGVSTPISYTYDSNHLLLTEKDPRGNVGITTTYYPDGRLQSVTDALGNKTAYSYDLNTHTTMITAPDGGVTTYTYDSFGMLISEIDSLGNTVSATYDTNHNLLSVTDALGNKASFAYDSQGHPTSVTDPLGKTRSVTYNQFGGPTTLTDALGNVWSITYDAVFHPISVTDSLGNVGSYTWDSHGQPLTRKDGNGQIVTYTYDQFGNLLSETDPLGNKMSYTYDTLGRMLTSTDARGSTTKYSYDALGRLLTTTDSLGQVTTNTYDANGNQLTMKDALGRVTSYTYDVLNQLMKTTYPDGTTTSTTYDFRGNPLTETDQAGHLTSYTYDKAGQELSSTSASGTPDAATMLYAYDDAGNQVTVTDSLGHATSYAYDAAGRLLSVTDPLGNRTAYTYDAAGHLSSMTDANGHKTQYGYDIRGRQVTVTYADGTTTQQSYDGAGNLISSTDQAGKITTYTYDHDQHLLSVEDALHNITSYTYDPNGNLLTITDANGHQTSFAYDALNRQIKKTWPDGSFETFGFDAVGNQTSHGLTDGHTNTYTYDVMDRLTKITFFDSTSVSYAYTPTGKRQSVTDARGTTTYTYDNLDRLLKVTQPNGQSIAYTYDGANNRLSMTTPAGTTNYAYDGDNRLTSVMAPGTGTISFAYDKVGNRTQLLLPNGITIDYGYDSLNRLISLNEHAGTTTLTSYTYTLGPAGNRIKVAEADGTSVSWSYDADYRLTGETVTNPNGTVTSQASYTYDAVGNRLTETSGGLTTTYSYNALDQLTSFSTAGQTAQYSYDGRGNRIQVRISGGGNTSTTSYTYNATDQLVKVTLPGGTTATYTYDADGKRVSQTVGTSVTNYLWDEASTYGNVVLETDGSGTIQASYVLGDAELLAQVRGGTASYYLPDGQGSVRALTNSSGTITDTSRYDAYGNLQSSQGTTVNPYGYTGQRYDAQTGLYYLRARSYDPGTGTFLSRDPAGIATGSVADLNRYTYARSSPIDFTDPTGYGVEEYALATEVTTDVGGAIGFHFAEELALSYISDLLYLVLPEEEAAEVYGWIQTTIQLAKDIHEAIDLVDLIHTVIALIIAVTTSLPSPSPSPSPAPSPSPGSGGTPGSSTPCGGVSTVPTPVPATDARSFKITSTGYANAGRTTSRSYPVGIPSYAGIGPNNPVLRPCGPFRFLDDYYSNEYTTARGMYTTTVRDAYKRANGLMGAPVQIHHVQPIKFAGSPTDTNNFVPLTIPNHQLFTDWWGGLQDQLSPFAPNGVPTGTAATYIEFYNPGIGHL